MTTIEYAYAKINIGLKVLDRRPDGFHSILSIFQTVDVADKLEMTGTTEPGMKCSDKAISDSSDNLVLKAEKAFRDRYPDVPQIRFDLKKNIPVGAGLGGGSADAAAALRGLCSFHRLDLPQDELVSIAETIGSDVPFFLTGGTAIVSGRGEVIEPVEWPFHFTYVLVYPNFQVSTAWAYSKLESLNINTGVYMEVVNSLRDGSLQREDLFNALVNDFEEPVCKEYPILWEIKQNLITCGASNAFMSGSGSTMIGLFESELDAFHCANMLNIKYCNQCSIFTVPAVGQSTV